MKKEEGRRKKKYKRKRATEVGQKEEGKRKNRKDVYKEEESMRRMTERV